MMARSNVDMSFIICKAHSEENKFIDPYVNILKNQEFEAQLVPTLEFEYYNFDELNQRLQKPQNYSGMVITSPRCAQSIIKCLDHSKLNEDWHKKPMFVVGETTSRIVTNELNFETIGADSGNAMSLIPIILKYKLNKPLLSPCGNLNINILSSNIKSVEFENIEVYRTVPHRDLKTNLNMVLNKIKNKIGIIFFSPSGFHAILDLIPNELLSQVHMFAIGPTTGTAIKEAGYILSGICEKPKPESMLCMINTFIEYTVTLN